MDRTSTVTADPPRPARQRTLLAGRGARRNRRLPVRLKVGLTAIAVLGIAAILAPPVFHLNPYAMNASAILQNPSWHFWFGTDDYGRNLLARVIFGMRTSLEIAFSVTALTGSIGLIVAVGIVRVRLVSSIALPVLDALMALPAVVVGLALVTLIGPGFANVLVVETLFFVPWSIRVMRASMLNVESAVYVEAALSQGATGLRLVRRHILPNAAAPMVVQQVLIFGYAILAEAVLSFLGVGINNPTASLGNILTEAQQVMLGHPLFSVFPGVTIALLVLAVNLIADGIAEYLQVDRPAGLRRTSDSK